MKTLSSIARDFELLADGSRDLAHRCIGTAYDMARWNHYACESTYRWCAQQIREFIEKAKKEENETGICPWCAIEHQLEVPQPPAGEPAGLVRIADGPF